MINKFPSLVRNLSIITGNCAFRNIASVVSQSLPKPCEKEILIKNKYVGINSADMKFALSFLNSSRYNFPAAMGVEGIGQVIDVGDHVQGIRNGQYVMYLKPGVFCDYMCITEEEAIPVAACNPQLLTLLISGVTASISLDKCARIIPGDNVLITSAAGEAGHIAVQWAKNTGCHVIGICSSDAQVEFSKSIGCDRPINYNKENIANVLNMEYPNGVDVIWDDVGEEKFANLYENLSLKGCMVEVGTSTDFIKNKDNAYRLLLQINKKSGIFTAFHLPHYKSAIPHYMSHLVGQLHEQKLELCIDDGSSLGRKFIGLDDIPRAVEYLHSGQNIGKVVVAL